MTSVSETATATENDRLRVRIGDLERDLARRTAERDAAGEWGFEVAAENSRLRVRIEELSRTIDYLRTITTESGP